MRKFVLGILLICVLVMVAACAPPTSSTQPVSGEPVSGEEDGQLREEGRVVFAITDVAADMGAVTSVMITVGSVRVHSATEGWVTVSSTPKTVDLLKLKAEGNNELLADVTLKESDYEQLRLDISKVVVVDDKGEHEATLPSGELKIVGGFTVTTNSTSTATFDFIADESLHLTGSGEYILAPVVQLETRENAEVEIKADKKVEVKGGKVKTNVKVGMDVEGKVGVGLGIAKEAKLSLSKGKVVAGAALEIGDEKKDSTEEDTNVSAGASAKVKVGY
ncbi:DUF4382 domain-containing protein [Candidatus Woesearchaeota archaeon]|nr:DUF4382 domain-containing protein [Candidatus Woesearchaeota archaeon]